MVELENLWWLHTIPPIMPQLLISASASPAEVDPPSQSWYWHTANLIESGLFCVITQAVEYEAETLGTV